QRLLAGTELATLPLPPAQIQENRPHPGAERKTRVVSRTGCESRQKRVLDDVFGPGRVAKFAPGNVQEGPAVAPHQHVEQFDLPALHTAHDLDVVEVHANSPSMLFLERTD